MQRTENGTILLRGEDAKLWGTDRLKREARELALLFSNEYDAECVGGEDDDTELARTRALCENYIGKPVKSFDFPLAACSCTSPRSTASQQNSNERSRAPSRGFLGLATHMFCVLRGLPL
jgi:hypothetical protein